MTFAEPDLRRRAFLFQDCAGYARADQDAGWHVRDVDPERNALRQSHPVNVELTEERSSGLAASFAASARHPYTLGREHRQQSA
jgi:hypothetical protein